MKQCHHCESTRLLISSTEDAYTCQSCGYEGCEEVENMSVNGTHLINGWLVWETHYNGSEASDHCVLVDQIETFNGPSQYGHTEIRTKSGQVLRAPGEARALLLTYLKLRGKLRSDAQMARKIV